MPEEKPLHVQVAEALGWTEIEPCGNVFCGRDPEGIWQEKHNYLPNYDTDWSATGPLIERYKINIFGYSDGGYEATSQRIDTFVCKECGAVREHPPSAEGSTPLIAVCHLLLALHKAGKLQV